MRVGVVGAGIFGIAAALELRGRGHDVTVFEQGAIPYEKASSTDTSKTIRRLYGDNETYVELAERAAQTWARWNERLGGSVYFPIGQIEIVRTFRPGRRIFDSWQHFARRGGEVRILSVAEARARYPQFGYEEGDACVYDPWGGYLASGQAVKGLAQVARDDGAEIREQTMVLEVEDGSSRVRLIVGRVAPALDSVGESGRAGPGRAMAVPGSAGVSPALAGKYSPHATESVSFDRVVVAAGVWLKHLVPTIGRHIRPTFQEMAFFEPVDRATFAPGTMPVWGINPEEDGWYGHPLQREGWVKVANDLLGPAAEPDDDRQASPSFVEAAREFVARRIPALARGRVAGSRACLYENTPDRHFVIDWVPGSQRILVAGGGSGHGFKFGGSIGAVIANALEDESNLLGDLFRVGRRFE